MVKSLVQSTDLRDRLETRCPGCKETLDPYLGNLIPLLGEEIPQPEPLFCLACAERSQTRVCPGCLDA